MTTEAMIGYNTTLEVTNGADTSTGWFELGEITNIQPPDDQTDLVDATHMKSPLREKEYISGLSEGGEGSFDLNWIPGRPTDAFCRAWKASGVNRIVRITYPNGASEQWPAVYRGFSRQAPTSDKLSGTLTVKKAGAASYVEAP